MNIAPEESYVSSDMCSSCVSFQPFLSDVLSLFDIVTVSGLRATVFFLNFTIFLTMFPFPLQQLASFSSFSYTYFICCSLERCVGHCQFQFRPNTLQFSSFKVISLFIANHKLYSVSVPIAFSRASKGNLLLRFPAMLYTWLASFVVITPRAYAQAGLSNQFCPSVIVVVVCHKSFEKPSKGRFRGLTISKRKVNAEIRDTYISLSVPDTCI